MAPGLDGARGPPAPRVPAARPRYRIRSKMIFVRAGSKLDFGAIEGRAALGFRDERAFKTTSPVVPS